MTAVARSFLVAMLAAISWIALPLTVTGTGPQDDRPRATYGYDSAPQLSSERWVARITSASVKANTPTSAAGSDSQTGRPAAAGVAAEGGLSGAGLLARQADILVSGDLSAAGRALAKHGGRPGSAFPAATGSQAAISEQAGLIVRNILQNQTRRIEFLSPRLKMQVVDIYDGTGRGLRYSKDGDFIGFLEPPR